MNSLIKGILYIFFNFFLWAVKLWYSTTMYFTQNENYPVQVYDSADKIIEAMKFGNTWRSDPWGGILDNLYHPTRIQKNIDEQEDVGDCDDHAIYWCATLLKSGLAKRAWISFYHMEKSGGKISGHVVCVYQDLDGLYYWTDYRRPKPLKYKHQWYEESSFQRGATPLHAAMIEIKHLKFDDTPVFGRVVKLR